MLPSSAIDYLPSLGVFTKTKKNVVDPCDQSDTTDGSPHDGQTPRGWGPEGSREEERSKPS